MAKTRYLIGIDPHTKRREASVTRSKRALRYSVGVDEVGRGCLAGPVVVTALAVPRKLNVKSKRLKAPLRDSKKLTAKQREGWAEYVKNQPEIIFETAYVYPKGIERLNISQAANLAATRAVARLLTTSINEQTTRSGLPEIKIFLDGGLYLDESLVRSNKLLVRTVVRGDEKFNCIKLASIIAKVSRDRAMRRLHEKFPVYGLDEHKGYGTKQHIATIKKHGLSVIHRADFCSKFV